MTPQEQALSPDTAIDATRIQRRRRNQFLLLLLIFLAWTALLAVLNLTTYL